MGVTLVLSESLSLALACSDSLRAAILALVSTSLFAIVLGILGGAEILVGSLTGIILLFAVILTNFEADAGLATCGFKTFWLPNLALTGVIISFGGGVLGLGGLIVTFTSIGACLGC